MVVAPRRLPLFAPPRSHTRAASFSLPSISKLFRRTSPEPTTASAPPAPDTPPQGLFDAALDDLRDHAAPRPTPAPPTYHKSSTANFKTSRRKLNDLSRLIAGRPVDEGVLQLQMSPKKQASRLLSMLALARDHAVAKGLSRDKLVIAQSWTTQGPSLPRLDIKGRGRHGVKHHPSSKLHVLLAEGLSAEEKRRARTRDQWRRSLRGLAERDSVGVGSPRKLINVGLRGWRW